MMQNAPLEITVVKPHWLKRGLLLFHHGDQVGKIEYTGSFKLDSVATILDERWKIMQSGFWKTSLEFRGSNHPFQKLKVEPTFGGKIEWIASDNSSYIFRKIKWWKNTWAWYDEDQNVVIEIRPDHTFTNKQAHITIYNTRLADYRLMTLIGIFVFTIQKSRAAAAAT